MKKLSIILCIVLALSTLAFSACKKEPDAPKPPKTAANGEIIIEGDEYKVEADVSDNYRTFYEIFTGSFSDSNGDGKGDLRGIINRMDYLNDGDPNSGVSLGIEGIWLTPIFKSGTYHKYDVIDYYTIDPDFGTLNDLKDLIAICHERNVKLIIDLPINHTSSNCEWFKNFKQAHIDADTASDYYYFYSYYARGMDKPDKNTYSALAGTNLYYECNFDNNMPEANFDNEFVRQTFLDVAKYYLELGIDGFRFDAAYYIYKGNNQKNVEFWDWYIGELRKVKSDVYTISEVWPDPYSDAATYSYFSSGNCFNFTTSQSNSALGLAAKSIGSVNDYTRYLSNYLKKIKEVNENAMASLFLSNHDTNRSLSFLSESGQMEMAANMYLLASGSPFIYYGEEIAMRGSRDSSEMTDANRRLAMNWGDGDTIQNPKDFSSYVPISQTNPTAAEQMKDNDSLYTYYKRLIALRKANPEIARGTYTAMTITGTKAGGFVVEYQGSTLGIIHNATKEEVTIDLSAATDKTFNSIITAIGYGDNTVSLKGTTITIAPQTSVILK